MDSTGVILLAILVGGLVWVLAHRFKDDDDERD